MAKIAKKDEFAQMGYIVVTESAANTLTFNGISVFSNILTPKGMIIHEVEYNVSPSMVNLIVDTADAIKFGLHGDDSATTVALDSAQTYDYNTIGLYEVTAANSHLFWGVHRRDFTGLPGGGKLVPADRLYGYCQGTSLATPLEINIRFLFTLVDLTAQQYIELAQALRVLT